jgi:hypothetical protein
VYEKRIGINFGTVVRKDINPNSSLVDITVDYTSVPWRGRKGIGDIFYRPISRATYYRIMRQSKLNVLKQTDGMI